MDVLRIDGSTGEGGGQILRSSLSLSLVTGKPFCIENIRAKRERPGLLRQHLTAVQAACEISGAEVQGASLGSQSLTFTPGTVKPGNHRFVVGTAGSGTLVLQTVLPALMMAKAPSELTIEGGTHNLLAPPFDFLEKAFLPVLNRLGPKVTVTLNRYGFYPAGGGSFTTTIIPCARLTPVELFERGEMTGRKVTAIVANLARKIAERELKKVVELLDWKPECMEIRETSNSAGPGNILLIEITMACGVTEVFCGFGRIGTSAENVATDAVCAVRAYLASEAVAGEHLTDQLLLPFALAGGGVFTAEKLNQHTRTNMDVIGAFLPVRFDVSHDSLRTRFEVRPSSSG